MTGSFIDVSPWLGMPSTADAVKDSPRDAPKKISPTQLETVQRSQDERKGAPTQTKPTKKEKKRKKNEELQCAIPQATTVVDGWSAAIPPTTTPHDLAGFQLLPEPVADCKASVVKKNDWSDDRRDTNKDRKENSKRANGKSKVYKLAKEETIQYGPVDTENDDWVEVPEPVRHHQQETQKLVPPSRAWIRPCSKAAPKSTISSRNSTRPSLTTAFTSIFFDVDCKKASMKTKHKGAPSSVVKTPPLRRPASPVYKSESPSPLRYPVPAMSQADTSPQPRHSTRETTAGWTGAGHPPPPPSMAAESSGSSKAAFIRSTASTIHAIDGSGRHRNKYMMSGALQPAGSRRPSIDANDRPSSTRSIVGSHVSIQASPNEEWQTYQEVACDAPSATRRGEDWPAAPPSDRGSARHASKGSFATNPSLIKHTSSSSRRLRAVENELAMLRKDLQRLDANKMRGERETAAARVSSSPIQALQDHPEASRHGFTASIHRSRHHNTLVSRRSKYHPPSIADDAFRDPTTPVSALSWSTPPAGTRSPHSSTYSRHLKNHTSHGSHRSRVSRHPKVSGTGLGPFESGQTNNPEIWSPPPPPPPSERWSPEGGAVQPFDSVSNVSHRDCDSGGSGASGRSKRTLRAPSMQNW